MNKNGIAKGEIDMIQQDLPVSVSSHMDKRKFPSLIPDIYQ